MKIRYRTMTLPVSILASVALVETGFVAAPVADGAVVPAISDGQTATPTVIGQVPATFTGQMTVTNDIVTTSPGRRDEVNSTTSYNLQLKLQEVSSLGGTFYQWNLVVPSSTWHTTYNETSTDNDPQCIQHGVADTGGNFDNPPDSMLMRQLDNGQGPDIETVTPFFEVQGTSTCESGGTWSEQAGSSCQHQDDTPPITGRPRADCVVPALDGRLSRAGSDSTVRLEEGVIGMLRKLSRKARGVHHGP